LATTGIAASNQNQALNALVFFSGEALHQKLGSIDALRAKRPVIVREALPRLIVHLLYACGLRVNEPLNLRIKDLDLARSPFYIHQAKVTRGEWSTSRHASMRRCTDNSPSPNPLPLP